MSGPRPSETSSREPSPSGLGPSGFDPARLKKSAYDPDNLEMNCQWDMVRWTRDVMKHWTGTNCTFVVDDTTALGILAGIAISKDLHRDAAIPSSMVDAIDEFKAAQGIEAGTDETRSGSAVGESPVAESDASDTPSMTPKEVNNNDR